MALRKSNRKSFRPRTSSKKRIIRKALAKSWKKSVAKVCKRVISKTAEVKSLNNAFSFSPLNGIATTSDISNSNIIWCSPNASTMIINQGVDSDSRLGNKIKTVKCNVKVIMYPKPYDISVNVTPRPQIVTIWCVSAKQGYVSQSSMGTLFDTVFFQSGSTSVGYLSQLIDSISPVNKDVIQLHWKRSFKLGHATHYAQPNQATEPYPSNVQYSNNDYKMNHMLKFSLTKAMPKYFNFNDANDTPNNRSVFLIFGIANADGTPFTNGSTQRPVDVYATVDYFYTDM